MEFILKKLRRGWAIYSPKGHPISGEISFKNRDEAITWGYNYISSFTSAKLRIEG